MIELIGNRDYISFNNNRSNIILYHYNFYTFCIRKMTHHGPLALRKATKMSKLIMIVLQLINMEY